MHVSSRKRYWEIVRECLRQFYGFTVTKALTSARKFRREMEEANLENEVYHDEPYEIACDIAGIEPSYDDHWDAYRAIREKVMPGQTTDDHQTLDYNKARSKGSRLTKVVSEGPLT